MLEATPLLDPRRLHLKFWSRLTRRACLLLVFASVWLVTRPLPAQQLSPFEQEIQNAVFEENGLALDAAPEGKLIEGIDVFVIEPFDERDPLPNFVNSLHVQSRAYVVEQELALSAGSPYSQERADDSVRNLRSTYKFSLVLITTARGSAQDRVRLVVIVKDIWSLRLNWNIEAVDDRLTLLLLNPSEVNLLGTHTTFGLLYVLEPDRHTLGARAGIPQVGASNIGLYLTGGAILERSSGQPEGSFGYFHYGRALRSRYDRWAWSIGLGWRNEVTRRYRGAEVRSLEVPNASGAVEHVPEVFKTDRLAGEYELERSFGTTNKTGVAGGVEVDRRRYRAPDLSGYSERARDAFEAIVLPTSDVRISPFLQVTAYRNEYHRLLNVETLALQEDIRLGHGALLRVYPASRAIGSSRSLVGVDSQLSYGLPLGRGMAIAKLGAEIVVADQNRNDVLFDAGARVFSPATGFGRFHLDVLAIDIYRSYLNTGSLVLGGENRLRGYAFSQFRGDKLLAVNAEFRSLPIEILGAHVSAVAFYDLGDAQDDYADLDLKQSVGLGARFLLPQFDRSVFRADWGVPLSPEFGGFPGGLTVSFGHAFSLPGISESSVLDGVLPE